jgi:septal ring factor EnvC (AmiA/AmiB activator)
LDIGRVVKVKGTISEFRGQKQVELKRIWVIKTTNEEARSWEEAARFKMEVLDKPWHITKEEHSKIKAEDKAERRKNREWEKAMAAHEEKKRAHEEEKRRRAREYEKYMAEREKRLEVRRRREEVMMNAGALI